MVEISLSGSERAPARQRAGATRPPALLPGPPPCIRRTIETRLAASARSASAALSHTDECSTWRCHACASSAHSALHLHYDRNPPGLAEPCARARWVFLGRAGCPCRIVLVGAARQRCARRRSVGISACHIAALVVAGSGLPLATSLRSSSRVRDFRSPHRCARRCGGGGVGSWIRGLGSAGPPHSNPTSGPGDRVDARSLPFAVFPRPSPRGGRCGSRRPAPRPGGRGLRPAAKRAGRGGC